MREIRKSSTPKEVHEYLNKTPGATFGALKSAVPELREYLLEEQKGLCGYCCGKLPEPLENGLTRIAHVSPRSLKEVPETDYQNMILSCDTSFESDSSCDVAQASEKLPVSPLTPYVQSLFQYKPSGEMTGLNQDATATISILNLDCAGSGKHRLRNARREAIMVFLKMSSTLPPKVVSDTLNGNYQPLPAFQPAIAYVMKNLTR